MDRLEEIRRQNQIMEEMLAKEKREKEELERRIREEVERQEREKMKKGS